MVIFHSFLYVYRGYILFKLMLRCRLRASSKLALQVMGGIFWFPFWPALVIPSMSCTKSPLGSTGSTWCRRWLPPKGCLLHSQEWIDIAWTRTQTPLLSCINSLKTQWRFMSEARKNPQSFAKCWRECHDRGVHFDPFCR